QGLAHPTWRMGLKITVDSATLANKGLEVIEAHFLFGLPYDRIEVVVHPTSIVHGLVRFRDGAAIAHLGYPDMRVPISYALTYPQRVETPVPSLDLTAGPLELFEPDVAPSRMLAAARAVGMTPRKFYIGFGPAIAKRTRGGVEYGIGSIPLGGYVKIPGMSRPSPGDLRKLLPPDVAEKHDDELRAIDDAIELGNYN